MSNAIATQTIELRKVKISDFASRETTCFEAEVWVDGKRIGWVGNDGRGGMHEADTAVYEIVGEYAKTLPERPWGFTEGTYQPCFETVIDDLLTHHIRQKDVKSLMRKTAKYVLYYKDGDFWTCKAGSKGLDATLAYVRERLGDTVVIINDMTAKDAEAFIHQKLSH